MLDALKSSAIVAGTRLWTDIKRLWPLLVVVIAAEWFIDMDTTLLALLIATMAYVRASE